LLGLDSQLLEYFADLIRALRDDWHRRAVTAALIGVSLGYSVLFLIVFGSSRWVSSWAVCMFLTLHAVKTLPASREVRLPRADDRKTEIFGWIVTLIPRVGIIRPF